MSKWKMVKLRDIASLITKGTTPTTIGFQFENSGVNFVKIESLTENGTFIKKKLEHISKECNDKMKRSILCKNDILFSIAGALGKTAIVDSNILPANTNQALAIIRIPKCNVNYRYISWALKSSLVYKQYQKQKQGVAQLNLSLKNVSDLEIPLPALDIQAHIADALDKVQDITDCHKEQLKELDNLIKAVFYDMFGDPVINNRNWEIKKLGDVCDVRDGTHDSPKYIANGYPLVTSKNVVDGTISFKDINYISKEDYHKINERSKVDIGDIIMPMIGTIGKPVIVTTHNDFAIKNVALIKFTASNVNNVYIQQLLSSSYFEIQTRKKNRGGTQKFISLGDIRNLQIPLPTLDLQLKFARIVTNIEKQKNIVKKSMAESQYLLNSLMSKYLD